MESFGWWKCEIIRKDATEEIFDVLRAPGKTVFTTNHSFFWIISVFPMELFLGVKE